jgi:hypothetical protein
MRRPAPARNPRVKKLTASTIAMASQSASVKRLTAARATID